MNTNIYESSIESVEAMETGIQESEILVSRLFLLRGKDKIIMTMYLEKGISYRKIAILLGINPSSVSRKIKKLKHFLTNGIYVSCLKNMDQLTSGEMEIAYDHFLKGLTIKQIARKRKTSYYKIRQKIKEIQHTTNNL